MNASPHHSKVKVSLAFANPLFVAGEHVSGKMEMECRADKGLGIGIMMVELVAIQGNYFITLVLGHHLTTPKNSPRGTILLLLISFIVGVYSKAPVCPLRMLYSHFLFPEIHHSQGIITKLVEVFLLFFFAFLSHRLRPHRSPLEVGWLA